MYPKQRHAKAAFDQTILFLFFPFEFVCAKSFLNSWNNHLKGKIIKSKVYLAMLMLYVCMKLVSAATLAIFLLYLSPTTNNGITARSLLLTGDGLWF